jgi:antitoxin HicB
VKDQTLQAESCIIFISGQPFQIEYSTNLVGRKTAKFLVTLEHDEDGFVVASCPALPGCHSQGKTKEEAIDNIREAISGYIASMRKHGESIPVTSVEEVEVAV